MANRGWNSFHGFDSGPPPPGFPPAQPTGVPPFQPFYSAPQVPWPAQVGFAPAAVAPPPIFVQPGLPWGNAYPSIAPVTNGGVPGIHLQNGTGGVGLLPGYNYVFPKEHCRFHVFTVKSPPWQISVNKNDPTSHLKLMVPTNITVKELMQQLGCNNEDPKKNVLHEITEQGNGRWCKGLTMTGDDKERMKKNIVEFGWDMTRTGNPGERPVVWLWLTKD